MDNQPIKSSRRIFQGCLDPSLFRPFNFGSFTFDSILHRLFGSSANLTQSVICKSDCSWFDLLTNQVFRPRFRKQLLSLLAGRNFTVDPDFLKEVGVFLQSLTSDLQRLSDGLWSRVKISKRHQVLRILELPTTKASNLSRWKLSRVAIGNCAGVSFQEGW